MTLRRCCFTGHRQIVPEDVEPLIHQLDAVLTALYSMGCRDFYAGGAMGFDTLAAERTIAFRNAHPDLRLILMLPCRDQCRGWPTQDRARFSEILHACDVYRYVSERYDSRAMYRRNMALVEVSDVCVTYVRRAASGAGQTMRAAQRAGRTVINLADRMPDGAASIAERRERETF